MIKIGCDSKTAKDLSNKFSHDDLKKANKYVADQNTKRRSKNEPEIGNPWGYFRTVLRGRFWETSNKNKKQ